jgi:hypothetical protein
MPSARSVAERSHHRPARRRRGQRVTGSVEAKSIGALFVKRQPLGSHAFVKLKFGNVITLDGHDPAGGGVIIGVEIIEPCGWPLFVGLWEGANEVHAGFDSPIYHSTISRVRGTDHDHGEEQGVDASFASHTINRTVVQP